MNLQEYKIQRRMGMISLEYINVMANTTCREFMIKAHSTELTQPLALMLWVKCCLKHNISTLNFQLKFTCKTRARGGKKWGNGYMKLNLKHLTIGQVLHEMAHVIQFHTYPSSKAHGREFQMIFDLLLVEYYSNQLN